MGMGSFKPAIGAYQQENAMANAGAMVRLLSNQEAAFGRVGEAVDNYGQSRVRGNVSDLMGTDSFQKMNLAQAQAAVAQITGGRDLGQDFMKTLQMSNNNKSDIQSNEMKKTAASLLFGRQMSKQAQSQRNSLALADKRQAGDAALYGDASVGSSKNLLNIQDQVSRLNDEIKTGEFTDNVNAKLNDELQRKKIEMEVAIKAGKYNAGASQSLMQSVFPNDKSMNRQTSGKVVAGTNAPYKISAEMAKNTRGWSKTEQEAMQFGREKLDIRQVPVKDKEGKRIGTRFMRGDREISKDAMLGYYNKLDKGW